MGWTSSLHSEACKALGASDGSISSRIPLEAVQLSGSCQHPNEARLRRCRAPFDITSNQTPRNVLMALTHVMWHGMVMDSMLIPRIGLATPSCVLQGSPQMLRRENLTAHLTWEGRKSRQHPKVFPGSSPP